MQLCELLDMNRGNRSERELCKLFVWSCVKRVSKVSHFYLSDSKGHVCVVYSWLKAPSVPL